MKQIISAVSSMKTMVVMMLILAIALGYATFIENDYGTITSKADVYNARWFEILLALLSINLTFNIIKYKMFTLKKAPIFIFHVSFLIIIIGAAITRFIGFEGTMHIREGETATTMISTNTYFKVKVKLDNKEASDSSVVYLSKRTDNSLFLSVTLDSNLTLGIKKTNVKLVEYIPDAIEILSEGNSGGFEVVELTVNQENSNEIIKLKRGQFYQNDFIVLDFDSGEEFSKPVISIYTEDSKLFIKHNVEFQYINMIDKSKGKLAPSSKILFAKDILFGVKGSSFILKQYYKHATSSIASDPNASRTRPTADALKFKITVNQTSKHLMVYGLAGTLAKEYHTVVDGVDVYISYGSKTLTLPFGIELIDFQLDRYPGSMSPESYASEVRLIDKEQNINMPYRIFMNNILYHDGYRFFQSSYDKDEKGTILSVNNDPGTLPTYIGYFLLGLGMFWALFSRGNRFSKLSKKAKDASSAKMLSFMLSVGLLFSITPSYAQDLDPKIKTILAFEKEHATKFGRITIQDNAGRMKPMDTLSKEILAKLHRSETIEIGSFSLDSNQVVLGILAKPESYRSLKIILTKDEKINRFLGLEPNTKYAAFSQFFTDPETLQGYKIQEVVENAARKEAKNRDLFDKAILKVDERINIFYAIFSGSLLKIWPKLNDVDDKWYPTMEAIQTFPQEEAQEIRDIAFEFFTAVNNSVESGNWTSADKAVDKIIAYQRANGGAVMPSENRIKAEMFYNEASIFERIYPLYLLVGFILLVFSFIKILKPKFKLNRISNFSFFILMILFIAHTFGMGVRWYIADHAPWSNGYESMLYIAWATILAGFVFSRKSTMTMASTAVLTGLILFVAHLNWMDPQVTNIVPVLNSYWLSIHVAVITASYGFLGLGALLGFITILLFIISNKQNSKQIALSIKELNAINEMSIIIGLAFLTLGNFLGGVWANESWGRYWGWDPKETWTLVTIIIYAIVLHLRFVKSLYSEFNYSVFSLLSYTSVIMTYFGVNYYLAGMHSYAKGDPVPIPDFVPITYAILFVVIALAFRNRKIV
ncbi:MAG: cytochrome c biogenesis protein CcsA [Sulfurimonas sp.]|nr:cytochrome c biogenesis protein CcsA [Sulfurimonas sp.]